MKSIKYCSFLLVFLILVMSLISCGGQTYTSTKSARQLAEDVLSDSSTPTISDFKEAESYYAEYYLCISDSPCEYYILVTSSSVKYDEIGVIKCDSEADVSTVASLVSTYLDNKKESDIPVAKGYAPDEVSKLENAQVNTFGVYVVYTVLDTDETDAVISAVKNALK